MTTMAAIKGSPGGSTTELTMPKRKTMLSDELADLEETQSVTTLISVDKSKKMTKSIARVGSGIKFQLELARRNPRIVLFSLFIFAVLCAGGLTLIFLADQERHEEAQEVALELSVETARWFSDQLDQAILPLFSMAQFVTELDIFHTLPDQIGAAHEPGSLPFLPPKTEESPVTHRNVSGVCDEPELLDRFTRIASTVKRNANMNGVLVNLQLAPQAVVCLLHPMINTEDFPPGIVMDNTGAWGHDLLTDPARKFIAEATIPSDDIVIAGPLTLRQCKDCDATVEKAFIARIPIEMEGHEIVVNDVAYNKWGFAVALINWNALIERSDVYDTFQERGMEFQLTRTDHKVDPDTGAVTEKVVVLAETPEFNVKRDNFEAVTTALDTTNNEWEMTICYHYNKWEAWKVWSTVAAVVLSFAIGVLCFVILMQRENLTVISKRYEEDVAQPQKLRLLNFLEQQDRTHDEPQMDIQQVMHSNPIAHLFPNTTVCCGSITGFSSWQTEREPSQVFVLLQTISYCVAKIAKKHGVCKLDTSGERLFAVAGVPEQQQDGSLLMVKFARECILKSTELLKALEITLGPDTGDLALRFGLYSGPVTAGVLTGDKLGRLHLSGGTREMASLMESTGAPGRVHLSQSTVDQLLACSGFKRRWIESRRDRVEVTGGGSVQTYWIRSSVIEGKTPASRAVGTLMGEASKQGRDVERGSSNFEETSSQRSTASRGSDMWDLDESQSGFLDLPPEASSPSNKQDRLIEWQVHVMIKLLKKIVARRNKKKRASRKRSSDQLPSLLDNGGTPLEEVAEICALPKFESSAAVTIGEVDAVKIKDEVVSQLRALVTEIAGLYRENPFHNWEHASHVSMSVHKMLNRIVEPDSVNYDGKAKHVAADLHNHTFGINSDPLTHFAIVFSALAHDADHTGVSNGQLAKEQPLIAERYKNQSLAEQNSVVLAWELLMQPCYKDLHACLFGDDTEVLRFRQLVVNVILATDIFDKQLKELRNRRWDRAFNGESTVDESVCEFSSSIIDPLDSKSSFRHSNNINHHRSVLKLQDTNRKATIVIEHIIQASDVAHTMQHWQVYKKWNEKLFNEMYVAWKKGRMDKDPSGGWYKGEIWFFDNYVIPLAKKLKDCGVFGVSSDEMLHHAVENRNEWAAKGEGIVAEMVDKCKQIRFIPQQVLEEGDDEEESSTEEASMATENPASTPGDNSWEC